MPLAIVMAILMQGAPVATTRLDLADPVNCAVTPAALACRGKASRYRLPLDEDESFDRKADALRQDGRQCGLVGPKVCTRRPRTILSTAPE